MNRSLVAKLRRDPRAAIGVSVVVLVTLAAILAPLIARHDPFAIDLAGQLTPPGAEH